MRRLAFVIAVQVALAGVALPIARAAQEPRGRYIVVLEKTSDPDTTADVHGKKYGLTKRKVFTRTINGYSADIPSSRVDDVRRDEAVLSVTPNRAFHAAAESVPTGVERIHADDTIDKGTDINVAILDTGIDKDHPDLAANYAGGVNCVGDRGTDDDTSTSGHGTHVAGTVAAVQNSIGVRGVAPGVKLWSVRILNNAGEGTEESLLCGLEFVDGKSVGRGGPIAVANMSIEGDGNDTTGCGRNSLMPDPLHAAICTVFEHGVAVVVAAGNSNVNIASVLPATYDEVITATALHDTDGEPCSLGPDSNLGVDDGFATFSNYATLPTDLTHTVGAPGAFITSTWNNGGYAEMSGTSMAAPHVAGAAALYVREHPGATPTDVLNGLKAAGEPPDVNENGECVSGVSHFSGTGKHPERVVQVTPAVFTVIPPPTSDGAIGVQFAQNVNGVNDTNVVLRLASGGGNIDADVTYDPATHKALVDPIAPLVPGEYYQIVVSPEGSTAPTYDNTDPVPESAMSFRAPVLEQETSPWARYYWSAISSSSAYGGKYIRDRHVGSSAVFYFTGGDIAWYFMKGPDQGIARVYIDGTDVGTVDLYRSTRQYRVKKSYGRSTGAHTIKIVALGKRNSASSNTYVNVDAFAVDGTLYREPAVSMRWRSQSSSLASGGRMFQDSTAGANVYFHFRGTGVDWRAFSGPDQGYAKVYIDGVYKGEFDNYAVSARMTTRSFRGLSNAVHDIRIVVSGKKRSAASNYTVSVDYWRAV